MTIHCATMAEFIQVIAGLVQNGLTFEANADLLLIELTGGY